MPKPAHMFILIPIIGVLVILWLSYYTSASVYKSLAANHNRYARLIQVMVALGVFALLTVLLGIFIISQINFSRR